VNIAGLALLFDLKPLLIAAGSTLAVMELLASTELLLAALEQTVLSRWDIRLRWLHLLPLAATTVYPFVYDLPLAPSGRLESAYAAVARSFPDFALSLGDAGMWALVYAALAHPCNHVVRCLIDKRTD